MACRKKSKFLKEKRLPFFTLRRWLSWMYIVFVIFFILVSLIGKISSFHSYANLYFRTVVSGSMEPTIPIGSLTITKKINKENAAIGDIIAFRNQEDIVTHRIFSIHDGKIYTKGDANSSVDEGYIEENIEKVYLTIPKLGYFFLVIQTPRGTVALLSTILTLLLLDQFIRLLFAKPKPEKEMIRRRKKYAKKMVT